MGNLCDYRAKKGQRSHRAEQRARRARDLADMFAAQRAGWVSYEREHPDRFAERLAASAGVPGDALKPRDLIARYGVATGRISYFYVDPV